MKKVNLGSGHVLLGPETRKTSEWINVDANPDTGCDVTAEVPPMPFEDNSVDHILASHFIEHVPTTKKIELFNECWRVLKVGGTMEIYVPYAFHPAAHQDPTHVSYWVPDSGIYFTEQMAYLKYDIRVWGRSNWHLQDNGWVVEGRMVK